jgi:hypothetical protein
MSGLTDCYDLLSCSSPLEETSTSGLSTAWSPSPLPDITTVATGQFSPAGLTPAGPTTSVAAQLPPPHSITSSARASSEGGTVRPSAFAVLRLMASSYFVGACTGRSLGFSPFKNMIVLWGANIASQPNTGRHIMSARRRGLCAHQPAARAIAIPTPTAESPPMTEASHTTSRASSRTDFHIGGLPPLRGRSTAKPAVGSSHRHAHHRNFATYGTPHNPSSLSSNPRAQTTDVLAVEPNLARITDGATPAPGLDRCDCPANLPSKAGLRNRAARRAVTRQEAANEGAIHYNTPAFRAAAAP